MAAISLQIAFDTQQKLSTAEIQSVVTGVWALNFYGVDMVMHDFELCVPCNTIEKAAQILQGHNKSYHALPDCTDPDLYHCYREGAKRFRVLNTQYPVDLFLVSYKALGMNISHSQGRPVRGLKIETAHDEVVEYCEGVDGDALSAITWPHLADFLVWWLSLSVTAAGRPEEIIYLMYAEHLIDVNDVSERWMEENIRASETVAVEKRLLAGKERRLAQDRWE